MVYYKQLGGDIITCLDKLVTYLNSKNQSEKVHRSTVEMDAGTTFTEVEKFGSKMLFRRGVENQKNADASKKNGKNSINRNKFQKKFQQVKFRPFAKTYIEGFLNLIFPKEGSAQILLYFNYPIGSLNFLQFTIILLIVRNPFRIFNNCMDIFVVFWKNSQVGINLKNDPPGGPIKVI